MRPSIGRIILVPFVGGELSPAIVVKVHDDGTTVDCLAFQIKAALPVLGLPYAGEDRSRKVYYVGWQWPPRVSE